MNEEKRAPHQGEIKNMFTVELHLRAYAGPDQIYGAVILKSLSDIVADIDVVAVVDTSGSMEGRKMDMVKQTLHSICDLSTEGSTLTIVGFSDDSKLYTSLKPVKECHQSIDTIHAGGCTNIQAGIDSGIEQLGKLPKERRKALFAFTDGQVNRGIMDRGELESRFSQQWSPYDNTAHLWLASLGSSSDFDLVQRLAQVSETSTFNHIQDSDYGEFADNVGTLMATCQSSHSGTIAVCGQNIRFCLPRGGTNSYLFCIDNPGPIEAKVESEEKSLTLRTEFELKESEVPGPFASLVDVLLWKKSCLAALLKVSSISNSSDKKQLEDFLADLKQKVSALVDIEDNEVFKQEKKLLLHSIDRLEKALENALDLEELCRLSSEAVYLQRQYTSQYSANVGAIYRTRSHQHEKKSVVSPVSPVPALAITAAASDSLPVPSFDALSPANLQRTPALVSLQGYPANNYLSVASPFPAPLDPSVGVNEVGVNISPEQVDVEVIGPERQSPTLFYVPPRLCSSTENMLAIVNSKFTAVKFPHTFMVWSKNQKGWYKITKQSSGEYMRETSLRTQYDPTGNSPDISWQEFEP